MKLIYIYDFKLLKDKNMNYISKNYSYNTFQKYLDGTFKEVTIYDDKVSVLKEESDLNIVNGKNVNVIEMKKSKNKVFNLLNKFKNFWQLDYYNNGVIIRLPGVNGMIVGLICIMKKEKFIVEVVGDAYQALYFHGSFKKKIFAKLIHLLTKYIIKKASHVIYITQDYLQSVYPNRNITAVIPNVEIAIFDKEIMEQRLTKIKRKSENDIYNIGLVGSLNVKYKGHENAIEATKVLRDKGYNVKLEFVGEGKLENLSNKFDYNLAEFVSHLGIVNKEKLYKWYDSLDLYIQPSLTEAQGRSLIEAMSRGCPIVASNVGGIPELIQKDMLFSPHDVNDIVQKIGNIIDNKILLVEQAEANFIESKKYNIVSNIETRNTFLEKYIELKNF